VFPYTSRVFRLDQPIPYDETSFEPKKTKDGLQMNGLIAVYVRSDGMNSQIGVILGAESVGAGLGPRKPGRYMQYYFITGKGSKGA
jgi:hypothetical protein